MSSKSIRKNAVLNIIRVLASVVFPLITFPYAARILGADNLGKVQFSGSVVTYFSLVAALGVAVYGIREGARVRKDPEKFNKFASEVFSINMIATVLSYVALFVVLLLPTKLANYEELIWIQSIAIIFTTLGVDWIYSAQEDFLYITIKSVMVQLIALVLLFVFVKSEGDYVAYAFVTVIASVSMNIFNFFHVRKYCRLKLTRHLNLRRHLGPLLVLFANELAIKIYINSDVFMLGLMSSDYAVGIYEVAVKVYTIAKRLVNAYIAVTIPQLAISVEEKQKEKYFNLSGRVLKTTVVLILPLIVGLIMVSKETVQLIGGEGFMDAVPSLSILAVALLFAVLANYFATAVLVVNRKEKTVLVATIVAAVVNVGLNLILIPIWNQEGAAITTVVAEFIVMMICAWKGRGLYSIKGMTKNVLQVLAGCVAIVIICLVVKSFGLHYVASLGVSIVVSGLAYIGILIRLKNDFMVSLVADIRKKFSRKNP